MAEWGYPSDEASIRQRLTPLMLLPDHFVRIAQANSGEVAGWIHAGEHHSLASAPVCEIQGLVVGAHFRKLGIGRALVEAVLEWAGQRGFRKVQVHSNVIRQEAHPFYQTVGFTRTKTQHVYVREIG